MSGRCFHPLDPRRIVHPQPVLLRIPHPEACARERRNPFTLGIIAHMGWIAQQFDGLQMRIEDGHSRRYDIDEHGRRPRFQNPAGLSQPSIQVAPMMRRETASKHVERRILERQPLCGRNARGDICQSTLSGGVFHRRYHRRGQVNRCNGFGMSRQSVCDMATTRAQINRCIGPHTLGQRLKRVQILALCVNNTLNIGLRLISELIGTR